MMTIEELLIQIGDELKKEEEEKLEPKDWALIDLLKANPNGLTIENICDLIPQHFPKKTSISSHGNLSPAFHSSVENINKNWSVDVAIVKTDNEIWKIGSIKEMDEQMKNYYSRGMSYLRKYSYIMKKRRNLTRQEQVRLFEENTNGGN